MQNIYLYYSLCLYRRRPQSSRFCRRAPSASLRAPSALRARSPIPVASPSSPLTHLPSTTFLSWCLLLLPTLAHPSIYGTHCASALPRVPRLVAPAGDLCLGRAKPGDWLVDLEAVAAGASILRLWELASRPRSSPSVNGHASPPWSPHRTPPAPSQVCYCRIPLTPTHRRFRRLPCTPRISPSWSTLRCLRCRPNPTYHPTGHAMTGRSVPAAHTLRPNSQNPSDLDFSSAWSSTPISQPPQPVVADAVPVRAHGCTAHVDPHQEVVLEEEHPHPLASTDATTSPVNQFSLRYTTALSLAVLLLDLSLLWSFIPRV